MKMMGVEKKHEATKMKKSSKHQPIDETIIQNIEADAFWCLSKLIDGIQVSYLPPSTNGWWMVMIIIIVLYINLLHT